MNNVDKKYLDLLRYVLDNGHKKSDRTGVGTISTFGYQMRFNMQEGFPLLTTKKIFTKAVIHELLWFLKGGDNIKYLVDNGVNIWNEWPWQAYMNEHEARKTALSISIDRSDIYDDTPFSVKNMKDRLDSHPALTLDQFVDKIRTDDEFAKVWGDVGPIYGKQWVKWDSYKVHDNGDVEYGSINQIDQVIEDLKHNPDSRRIMVNAWNVAQIKDMKLPPCHWAFQLWTRSLSASERENTYAKLRGYSDEQRAEMNPNCTDEDVHIIMDSHNIPRRAVSLMFQMRSVDCFLGMPFDIASYGILLEMLAQITKMVPDELIVTSGDTHIYLNHLEQVKTQLNRTAFDLPTIKLNKDVKHIYNFKYEDIEFINYKAHASIKADVAI